MATMQLQAALPAGTQIPVDVTVQPTDTHRRWWVGGIALAVVVALAFATFLAVHQTDSATVKAAVASAQTEVAAREAAFRVALAEAAATRAPAVAEASITPGRARADKINMLAGRPTMLADGRCKLTDGRIGFPSGGLCLVKTN